MTRRRIIAGAVAIGALTLAGCSGTEDADADTVTYWSQWEQGEPQAEILQAAIDDFTAESGIEVEVEWQGRQIMQKVQPLLRSGDVPDVVDASSNDIRATLVRADQARDLSALFAADVPGEEATVSEVLGEYDDLITDESMEGPFMLPTILMAQSLFYDGNAHDLAQPADWSEFTTMLEELKTERGSGPIAVDGDIGSYAAVWTSAALIHELGAGGFNEIAADESGQAWDDEGVRTALGRIAELADGQYWADGSFGSRFPQVQEQWAAGEADLLFMGSWAPQETSTSTTEGFEYRQLGFPAAGNGEFMQSDVSGFAVLQGAENPEGAEQLLAHFVQAEVMQDLADDAAQLVTRPDVEPPETLADTAELIETRTAVRFYDGVDGDYPGYPAEVFEPVNLQLLRGEVDVDQAIEQLAAAQQSYWDKQG